MDNPTPTVSDAMVEAAVSAYADRSHYGADIPAMQAALKAALAAQPQAAPANAELVDELENIEAHLPIAPWREEGISTVQGAQEDGMILAGDDETLVAQCVMAEHLMAILALRNILPRILTALRSTPPETTNRFQQALSEAKRAADEARATDEGEPK